MAYRCPFRTKTREVSLSTLSKQLFFDLRELSNACNLFTFYYTVMHVEQWENQTWSRPPNTWIAEKKENNKLRVTWPSLSLRIAQGYLSWSRDVALMRFASLASILDTKYVFTDIQEEQWLMGVYSKLQNKLNVSYKPQPAQPPMTRCLVRKNAFVHRNIHFAT